MSAYVAPAPDDELTPPLTSAEISRLFKKSDGWFGRDVVRKRLYRRGFPHPLERGLWSAAAVARWLATAGENPDKTLPREAPRRKRRPNAYAPVTGPAH